MIAPIRLTPAVKVLLLACLGTFLVQKAVGGMVGLFGLTPSAFVFDFQLWQIVTYAFLHGDVMHLILNLMMLAFIGSELEALWGTRKFLQFYFTCVVTAGLLYLLLQVGVWGGAGLQTPMVGASGGIYGLLMAYGLLFGERVMLFLMIFPMKAKHFVWILMGVELLNSMDSQSRLASGAHLGGMVGGFGYLWFRALWQRSRAQKGSGSSGKGAGSQRRKSASHLKLIINNENPGAGGDDESSGGNPRTWH